MPPSVDAAWWVPLRLSNSWYTSPHCPRFNSDHVYRHGKTPAGHVRYRCPACPHVFQLTNTYEARKLGVKEKIVDMAFNGAGVRDTARALNTGINTVLRALKNSPQGSNLRKVVLDDVALICELDDQWAYVGNKNNRHWRWDTKRKRVVAYTFGPRNDEKCRKLLSLLAPFQFGFITSDNWDSYAREVPCKIHLTGKIFTQRIERNNLTLRTRLKRLARKTVCFSGSVELHDKVIGAFIDNHHFN
ncbi:IS1-like element ISAs8 family transposase [Aeromonas salmonicida]|uniref:IS1-like element ISAs8 family transposase n=1 Tax=Aeromonas salmonicida TaxID=645 RepID=UPI00366EE2C3